MSATLRADLVVYGGTPGGIACAIRAAREGASVLLVTHTPHLGGMLTSGLSCWDTQHEGRRSPIYDELREAIFAHYRETYGEQSEQYRAALPGPSPGHNNGNFEARVARLVVERLVARERSITVRRGCIPASARRDGRLLRSVAFVGIDGGDVGFAAEAAIFADCSYEGDLMKVVGVEYRVGREGRSEFGEPHAGKHYMRRLDQPPAEVDERAVRIKGTLKLRQFPEIFGLVETPDTGQGDALVQAYNWRTVLTDDPANRLPIPPPSAPVAADIAKLDLPWLGDHLPNRKIRLNRPQLVGRQNAYVEGDWATRRRVMDEHWNALLAVLHFVQNDPSVPEGTRKGLRDFGLAKDEFVDNGLRPYEIYVRESRRLRGRYVFSEHDALLAPDIDRASIHADSIAATEWYIDVHACAYDSFPGTRREGMTILHWETFPGQVPFRAILPPDLDNLLVPVCASSTHIGWGTIRLEPTWMNIGESAGFIAALAIARGVAPATLAPEVFQPVLARNAVMLSYLDDVDTAHAAAQYFGTKGFFAGYHARLGEPLTAAIAAIWADAVAVCTASGFDAMAVARRVQAAADGGGGITGAAFRRLLPPALAWVVPEDAQAIDRGRALDWLFAALAPPQRASAAS